MTLAYINFFWLILIVTKCVINLKDGGFDVWSDGTNLGEYNNWLRSQDANFEGERCAVLDTEMWDCTDTCEYPDGNWIAKNCTQKHSYMCKVKTGL